MDCSLYEDTTVYLLDTSINAVLTLTNGWLDGSDYIR